MPSAKPASWSQSLCTAGPKITTIVSGAGLASYAYSSNAALCDQSSMNMEDFSELFKTEYAAEFGLSGFCGYAAGFAVKRAAQVVIFTTGCMFVALQVMANHGYVTVHWDRLEKEWKGQLDVDGDGSVTSKDLNSTYVRLVSLLDAGLPGAAGFSTGFLFGLRS